MAFRNVVREEIYRSGEVEYTLQVVASDTKFYGSWICGACGHTGASSVRDENMEMAIWSAQANLSGHHKAAHEGSSPPPTASA